VSDYVGPSSVFNIAGVPPYDCVLAATKCVIAAAEEVDVPDTIVTVPVGVVVTPTIAASFVCCPTEADPVQVHFTLSRPVATPVSSHWSTVDSAASSMTAGVDYVPASGTVTFAPGETAHTATITLIDDHDYEGRENLTLAMDSPVGATLANGGRTTLSVRDNDPMPTVLPGAASVIEGDSGSKTIAVQFKLSAASVQQITVPWNTVVPSSSFAPPATADVDFRTAAGTLTFAPGETSKSATVEVLGDTTPESDEVFGVSLGQPTNAQRLPSLQHVAFVTIADDDGALVQPSAGSVVEGDTGTSELRIPLSLTKPQDAPVTVQWRTLFAPGASGDQAEPPADYAAQSGSVTFAAGATSQPVVVTINGDTSIEPDEYLLVVLTTSTPGIHISSPWGLAAGTIVNDD
jgi:hypothetical protein